MGNVLNFKKWNSSIDENSKYARNSFEDWKMLEQDNTNASQNTPTSGGEVPSISEVLTADIAEYLGSTKAYNEKVVSGTFNYLTASQAASLETSFTNASKKLIKRWDKDWEQWEFRVKRQSPKPYKINLNSVSVNEKHEIAYSNDKGATIKYGYIEDLLDTVNNHNIANGFKGGFKTLSRQVASSNLKKSMGLKYDDRLVYVLIDDISSTSVSSNQVILHGLLDVSENTKIEVIKKETTEIKKIAAKSSDDKAFEVGKYKLKNSDIVTELVDSIEKQLKDSGDKQFTKINVVSSASNYWGGKVPATHKLDGTILIEDGEYKSEPFKGKDIDELNEPSSKNKKLAFKRGEIIAAAVKAEGIKRGIASKDAKVSIEWRVSDTGGKNDEPGTDTPGQYFKVTVGGLGETKETVPGEIKKIEMLNFDIGRFGITLVNLEAAKKRNKSFLGIGQPRNIILKKGGKGFFAGGSRGKGGNRNQFGFAGYRGKRGGPSRN